MSKATIVCSDCLPWMREQADDSVSLTLCSPPYEAARTYGIDFKLRGQEWVDWMVERVKEMVRITSGLVVIVCEGQTRQFRWSAAPVLLMADLHRAGIHLRKPPIFHRIGIPGSGGPDYWRNDYEFCIVASKGGKLAWSDNTANGHPPRWAPGGAMSHMLSDGSRVNQWGHPSNSGATNTHVGGVVRSGGKRPSHVETTKRLQRGNEKGTVRYKMKVANGAKVHTEAEADGEMREQAYLPPVLANAGNVIRCTVGGGLMGSRIAHENEAPYPESLCEPFIRCFCPPNGLVYDPFTGSGTTGAVAIRTGRRFIGTDIRESQCELTRRRLAQVQVELLP